MMWMGQRAAATASPLVLEQHKFRKYGCCFLFNDINIIITTTTVEIVWLDWRTEGGGDLCGGGDL